MRKFICGLIIGLCLSGIAYGYRISKPQRITDFDQKGLVVINENFERIFDVLNGRYNLDVKTSVPTSTPTEGSMVAYSSGGVYRIYIYLNSGWRVFTSD